MQLDFPRWHVGFFGSSGTGKTSAALRLVCGHASRCVFIFDPEGEFSKRLKLPAVSTIPDLVAAVNSGWVLFDPHGQFPGNLEGGLSFFAEWALAICDKLAGSKFFVVDELDQYMSGNKLPVPVKNIAQTGRR